MGLYWLSFCDGDLPEGEQFLGVAICEAETDIAAVLRTHMLGINPGGEVLMAEVPDDAYGPDVRDRLLSKDEATTLAAA